MWGGEGGARNWPENAHFNYPNLIIYWQNIAMDL